MKVFQFTIAAIIALFAASINPACGKTLTLLAFGDSLTAGLGLPPQDAFPAQLQEALKKKGHDVRVINAGVSGETTSGALTRLNWTLLQNPDAVIVETGGNDMLRATPIVVTRQNIGRILEVLRARNIPVLLAGMRAFANFGEDYDAAYVTMFAEEAKRDGIIFYPFFLEGVAFQPRLLQPDGMHPNKDGVAVIVEKIMPYAEKLIAPLEKE